MFLIYGYVNRLFYDAIIAFIVKTYTTLPRISSNDRNFRQYLKMTKKVFKTLSRIEKPRPAL